MSWGAIHDAAVNVAVGVAIGVAGCAVFAAIATRRSRKAIVVGSVIVAISLASPWIVDGIRDLFEERQADAVVAVQGRRAEGAVPGKGWSKTVYARPGELIDLNVRVESTGNKVLRDVMVGIGLTEKLAYEPGSAKFANDYNAFGTPIPDAIDQPLGNQIFSADRLHFGDYKTPGVLYVYFQVRLTPGMSTAGERFLALRAVYSAKNFSRGHLDGPEIVVSN